MEESPSPKGSMPERIGSYRILEHLQRGGMGDVYRGLKETTPRREAAIKLIRPDKDDARHRARFEMELRALERMEHPYIAKIYDTGFTEDGEPWFAMELVKGVSLKEYCDRKRLTLADRLGLFQQVCEAVQHVHQKGIIHRDIKPGNVMVTVVDDRPMAKLIDFGLARAVDIQSFRKTLFEEMRRIVGTVAYMSPEQATRDEKDLDTRTDVYSLGVMLYELLTGDVPLLEELSLGNIDQLARLICEVEPKKPSTHLSELGAALDDTAARLRMDGRSLCRQVAGDLDWIVMKAIEKDRARRYATPRDLAQEIARHLRHEPIEAGPPGNSYRLKKWARRHRVGLVSASLVASSLLVAVAVTVVMQQKAIAADARALRAARDALLDGDFAQLVELRLRTKGHWPQLPQMVAAMDQWLVEADKLVARLSEHKSRAAAPAGTGADEGSVDAAIMTMRRRISDELEAFSGPAGILGAMRKRRQEASTIHARSVGDPEPKRLWAEAAARVAARDGYRFTLVPQVGLLPLGTDPVSGLEEFAVLQTGKVPMRRANERLVPDEADAIVLVLVPGGDVLIGATSKDPASPNYDPYALDKGNKGTDKDDEREGVLGVRLDPFFLGKYELTQAQWMRLPHDHPSTYGSALAPDEAQVSNPSNFRCGADFEDRPHRPTGLNPVENVSCELLETFLKHLALELPTEAQWEVACRAGGKGSWHVAEAAQLATVANLADLFARKSGMRWPEIDESAGFALDDGRLDTAPVGSFAPNDYGFYDMHGNVNEWCRDAYLTKRSKLRPGTGEVEVGRTSESWNAAVRGGSFRTGPQRARTAFRQPWPRASFYPITGARVSRAVSF